MKKITIVMLAISVSWALAMKETPKAISEKDEPFRCFLNPYDPAWKSMPPEEKESLAAIEALDARKDHFDFFAWIKGFDIDVTSNRELALLLIDAHAKKSETGLITNARATKLSWLRTLIEKETSPEKSSIVETPLQSTAPIAIPTEKEIVVVPTTDPSTPVLDHAIQTASEKDIVIEKEDPAMLAEDQKKADEILAWIKKANQNAMEIILREYKDSEWGIERLKNDIKNHKKFIEDSNKEPDAIRAYANKLCPNFNYSKFNSIPGFFLMAKQEKTIAISLIKDIAIREKLNHSIDKETLKNKEEVFNLKIEYMAACANHFIEIPPIFIHDDFSKETMTQIIFNLGPKLWGCFNQFLFGENKICEIIIQDPKHPSHTKLTELKITMNTILKKYATHIIRFIDAYEIDPLFPDAGDIKSQLLANYKQFSKIYPFFFDLPPKKFDL